MKKAVWPESGRDSHGDLICDIRIHLRPLNLSQLDLEGCVQGLEQSTWNLLPYSYFLLTTLEFLHTYDDAKSATAFFIIWSLGCLYWMDTDRKFLAQNDGQEFSGVFLRTELVDKYEGLLDNSQGF